MKITHSRRRAAGILAATVLAAASLAGCAGKPAASGPGSAAAGPRLGLELSPGPDYATTTRWLVFSMPIYPQVACWIETPDGRYVETIYVTSKGERKAWIGAPAGGRPEALPLWFHLQAAGARADAVSAPTPAGETRRETALGGELAPGRYVAWLEVNRSYDWNEVWTRDNSGVGGQPSIVYRADIELGASPARAAFVPVGTGSPDGSDGAVRPGLDGLTTALRLLSRAEITWGGL